MRYIDTSHITVPSNWVDLAKTKFGNNYTSLWSYFKEAFEAIVGKKCWYSESTNLGAKNPIDHFRPKADKIKVIPLYQSISHLLNQLDLTEGIGYSFLKFEFSNYRYACDIVNSPLTDITPDQTTRGKWDFFPIQANSPRATSLTEIFNERHCLLDPCKREDVEMLTFREGGQIEPHKDILEDSWEYCRVKVSLEVYHLHYFYFREDRTQVWNYCIERIELITTIYNKPAKTPEEINSLRIFLGDLLTKINKKSAFSAVAIDCILHCKNEYSGLPEYSWLENTFPIEKLEK